MSTPPERPNFFILLDLDPDAPWSQTDFEIRLKEKRQRWARDANSPNVAVKNAANRNLRYVQQIKEVMTDADQRRKEAKAARDQLAAENAARTVQRLADLKEEIDYYQNENGISRSEFGALKATYGDLVKEQDLKTRLGVPIHEDPVQGKSVALETLDSLTAKRIHDNLKSLSEGSLYTLLQAEVARSSNPPGQPLGPESPLSLLQTTAASLNKRMQESMDKGPDNTARKNLAGEAIVVFKSAEMRQKYDTTLRLEALDRLLETLGRLCQPAGMVTPQRAELFLRKACEASVSLPDARAALNKYIQGKKWPLILLDEPAKAIERLHTCSNCKRLNDPDALNCKWCGEPLWLDCPNCGAKHVDAVVLACPNCGFPLTLRRSIIWAIHETEDLIKESETANAAGQFAEARRKIVEAAEQLDEARREWAPKHPDDLVTQMNALYKAKIEPEEERIKKEIEIQRAIIAAEEKRKQEEREAEEQRQRENQAKRDKDIAAIETAIQKHEIYRAKRYLNMMIPKPPKESEYQKDISQGFDHEAQLLELARPAREQGDNRKAARLYQQIINKVCADSREAQDELRTIPLAAPTNLRIQPEREQSGANSWSIGLQWDPSPDADADNLITYQVSKSLTPLSLNNPGESTITTGLTRKESPLDIGVTIYYSVVAQSNGRSSEPLTGNILLPAPVENLECEITPREISLRWKAPGQRLRSICVRRAENAPPQSVTEGVEIAIDARNSLTSARDTTVKAGVLYGYSVFAQYIDAQGNPVWSEPSTIRAIPQTAPPFIKDLTAVQTDHPFTYAATVLCCTPPQAGDLVILRYDDDQHLPRPSSTCRWDRLTGYRRPLTGNALPLTDTSWLGPATCWYVPIAHVVDMAYVGEPIPFTCMQNVGKISATLQSDSVQLRWVWTHGCTRITVAYNPASWPSLTDANGLVSIARNGAADGAVDSRTWPRTGNNEAFFIVTAYAQQAGQTGADLASPGKRIRAHVGAPPQLNMSSGKRFASHFLKLTMHNSRVAPALVIVSQEGRAPASPADGIVRYRQESIVWENGELRLDPGLIPHGHFVAVFLTDVGEQDFIEVIPSFLRMP